MTLLSKVTRSELAVDSVILEKRLAKNDAPEEEMAERVGFEPTVEFPQHTLSKRAP
jgi:hypothetical protein